MGTAYRSLGRLRHDPRLSLVERSTDVGGERVLEGIDAGQAGRVEDLEFPIE